METLRSVVMYYGLDLSVMVASGVVMGIVGCMLGAMKLHIHNYEKKAGKQYKPGYVNYGNMRQISHVECDAYEQID